MGGTDLIEEDDGRRSSPGLAEHLLDSLLRLAHPLAEQLRALDRNKVELRLRGERFGHEGLRGVRHTHPCAWSYARTLLQPGGP